MRSFEFSAHLLSLTFRFNIKILPKIMVAHYVPNHMHREVLLCVSFKKFIVARCDIPIVLTEHLMKETARQYIIVYITICKVTDI
jgi:hypothetical protein